MTGSYILKWTIKMLLAIDSKSLLQMPIFKKMRLF